jgi:transposase
MKGGSPLALSRRRFTREVKVQVIREVEAGKALAQAARENQLHPTLIRRRQKEHLPYAAQAFAGHGHLYQAEARIAELERLVGQLTMENRLLKKALLQLAGRIRRPSATGER